MSSAFSLDHEMILTKALYHLDAACHEMSALEGHPQLDSTFTDYMKKAKNAVKNSFANFKSKGKQVSDFASKIMGQAVGADTPYENLGVKIRDLQKQYKDLVASLDQKKNLYTITVGAAVFTCSYEAVNSKFHVQYDGLKEEKSTITEVIDSFDNWFAKLPRTIMKTHVNSDDLLQYTKNIMAQQAKYN